MGQSCGRACCCCCPCYHAPTLAIGDTEIRKGGPNHSDCERIFFAIVGAGTNEQELIDILCNRSAPQRVEIARLYHENYGKDLIKAITDDTSWNFKNLLVGLAKEIHKATARIGTDDSDLIEILTTTSNKLIYKLRKAYLKTYNKPIEKVIESETSGNYRRVLLKCLKGHRDESGLVIPQQVTFDVQRLHEMGAGRAGTDDEGFIQFFCTRSPEHLSAVNAEYHAKYGKTIDQVIGSETSFNYAECLKALSSPRDVFFAHCLHKAITRLGTDDDCLMRILIRCSKAELKRIADVYAQKYNTPLVHAIKGDTSGWYAKALIACVEGENPQGEYVHAKFKGEHLDYTYDRPDIRH